MLLVREKGTAMDLVTQIMAYEQGDLEPEGILGLFSELVSSGQAWTLQGSYGRTAASLIQGGLLNEDGTLTETATDMLDNGYLGESDT